ncbi:Uncharacterised protein [Chromobacterium violaceum]|uniref:Uncharacterized protein n=1 Tax=Chromobacterium violaceum TaxID=536 RepID=A0A3S5DLX2_CHRVL|nr:Uncharacterised protein [Chromobacterium violaceum]
MSVARHTQILPSVLDRLLDDEPDQSHIESISLFELPSSSGRWRATWKRCSTPG